jgi:L-cysteine/cystine lyase
MSRPLDFIKPFSKLASRLTRGDTLAIMTFDNARVRDLMPSVTASVYLNAGTFGPVPQPSADAMQKRISDVLARGRIGTVGFARWTALMDETRTAFAQILREPKHEVALMHCTTDGINTVLWGLAFREGDEIVTTTAEHPGLLAPLEELARVKGVRIVTTAPTRSAIASALTTRTRLVALSHVLWTDGDVLPLEAIASDARAIGAKVLVDGAQSVGAFAFRPSETGADFYTASGQKWLCGPSGTGALWIRASELASLATPWPSYFSKNRMNPSVGITEYTTAQRLDASTLSLTAMEGLTPALAFHNSQVRAGAFRYAATLAESLRVRLRGLSGVRIIETEHRDPRATIVSFVKEDEAASMTSTRLERAGILARSIPNVNYVRASIGFWNNEADLEALTHALVSR